MQIIGYTDQWTVRPGQSLGLHVSSRTDSFEASVVRIWHGDTNPAGPGFKAEPVSTPIEGDYSGRWHDVPAGSYAIVDNPHERLNVQTLSIAMWLCPTSLGGHRQSIISRAMGGLDLFLDAEGRPVLSVGSASAVQQAPLAVNRWYLLVARWNRTSGAAELIVKPRDCWPEGTNIGHSAIQTTDQAAWEGPLSIAARITAQGTDSHFNGKIDSPEIYDAWLTDEQIETLKGDGTPLPPIAAWDFGADHAALTVPDSTGGPPARLIGMPMRAVTGRRWNGNSLSARECPQDYTAIHFHDDDRDDAGWPETLRLTVADDWPSGIYAFHLRNGRGEDYIPFFVLPARGRACSSIAFLAPTFSYLAYGNEHVADRFLNDPSLNLVFPNAAELYPSQDQDRYILEQKLHSSYDLHADGSGVAYVSRLVPQVHLRPKVHFQLLRNLQGSPHQFNADLHVIDWLREKKFQHDVITDEALHQEGCALLAPYRVIVTGTHPEYWTGAMLTALEAYLQSGGRVMYLGGNGFFWVTSVHPHAPHVLEFRKWGATRAWDAQPGERYHSTTGELGGTWRNRGRPPQKLVGVGFTAQGMDINAPYRRTEASYAPDMSFLFEGIDDPVFGDIPSLVLEHGAAGFELDRVDPALGSPPTTVCIAQSFNHSQGYHLAVEELLATHPGTGPSNSLVRSDIAYTDYPNGGAVFAVGSISYCGCLSYNAYENDISRLTENVLKHFNAPG